MLKNIYTVAHVGYESYDILGVFVDKKLANEFANQMNGEQWSWEKTRVYRYKIQTKLKSPAGTEYFEIKMNQAGDIIEAYKAPLSRKEKENFYVHTDTSPEYYAEMNKLSIHDKDFNERARELSDKYGFYTGDITFYIKTTKGRQYAIELANKRRLSMIKKGKWPKIGAKINENIN